MSFPTNVYELVSESLSDVISHVLNDEEIAQPANLVSVREAILADIKTPTIPLNRFSDDQIQELRDEIDFLIDQYGGDALAIRFHRPQASPSLTLLINAGIEQMGEPTLEQLFNALEQGLLAHLIAEGELDDDEAQTVTAELQALIDKHGSDALAEDLMSYS